MVAHQAPLTLDADHRLVRPDLWAYQIANSEHSPEPRPRASNDAGAFLLPLQQQLAPVVHHIELEPELDCDLLWQ